MTRANAPCCARCDTTLTCAACDERFDDLLKTVERLRAALADIARGDYSDPLCQRTPEQRARDALAGK